MLDDIHEAAARYRGAVAHKPHAMLDEHPTHAIASPSWLSSSGLKGMWGELSVPRGA
jgi:hypothetical protein